MEKSSATALKYLMLQWARRLQRQKWLAAFLYIAFPAVMVFTISLPTIGYISTKVSLGVGPAQTIPTIPVAPPSGKFQQSVPPWTAVRQLVWVDDTGGAGPLNVSAIVAGLPGRRDDNTVQFNSVAEMSAHCRDDDDDPPPCFAGLIFHGATGTGSGNASALNYTLMFPNGGLKNGLDVGSLGPFGSAGLLTLQMTVERGAAAQMLPGAAQDITASTTRAVPFTHLNKAEMNSLAFDYFFNFLADTGSASLVLVLLPQVFWLAHTAATDAETRTRDAMLIMGLPQWTYTASLALQYLALSLPSWLCVAGVLSGFTFQSLDFFSALLMLALPAVALFPASLAASKLFTQARLAGSAVAFVCFVLGAVCSQIGQAGPSAALRAIATILFPPAGLSVGITIVTRAEEADVPIQPSHWYSTVESQGISFGGLLAACVGSIVLHGLLLWHIERAADTGSNILPSCSRARGSCSVKPEQRQQGQHNDATVHDGAAHTSAVPPHQAVDGAVSIPATALEETAVLQEPAASAAAGSTPLVSLSGVWKVYPRAAVPSVRALSLDCYDSEVLVLLGKNGCGKTTTVHMITGILQPSRGAITFGSALSGGNQATDSSSGTVPVMTPGRIGWCPQHDILWSDVSVRHTLELYAAIKGVPAAEVAAEAEKWADNAGLSSKIDALAGTLSGGQKRRLSLAAALIGGSTILLLDEPTAGVDPVNRRLLWDIINTHKTGRTVLLTTHFLDEAEALADRIAVMDKSELKAIGTSLFLKRSLGFGYNLTAVRAASGFDLDKLLACIHEHVPQARVVSRDGRDVTLGLPLDCNPVLPALLRQLEASTGQLGIDAVGISSASLHDVFMSLVGSSTTGTGAEAGSAAVGVGKAGQAWAAEAVVDVHPPAQAGKILDTDDNSDAVLLPPSSVSAFFMRLGAVLEKRALLARKDWRAALLPLLLMTMAAVAVRVGFNSEEPRSCPVSLDVVPPATPGTVQFDTGPYGPSRQMLVTAGSVSPPLAPALITSSVSTDAMLQTLHNDPAAAWGAIDATPGLTASRWPSAATVAYDLNLPLADFRAINTLHNALYASLGPGTSSAPFATVNIQPFPFGGSAFGARNWKPLLAFIGIFIVAASVFVPLASTMVMARERVSGLKLQQRMSGLGVTEYWLGNLLWDCLPVAAMALMVAGGLTGMPAWLPGFGATVVAFALYGLASTAWGYALTFASASQAAAVAAHGSVAFLLGIGFVAGLVTAAPDPNTDFFVTQAITYSALAAHPIGALTMGVIMPGANIMFTLCGTGAEAQQLVGHHNGSDGAWMGYFGFQLVLYALAGHFLVAMAVVLLLDNWDAIRLHTKALLNRVPVLAKVSKKTTSMRGCGRCCRKAPAPLKGKGDEANPELDLPIVDPYEDIDVSAERDRVLAAYGSGQAVPGNVPMSAGPEGTGIAAAAVDDSVVVQDVRKQFWARPAPVVAVHGVTLGLASKECFGHLGPNGAGKTTLLRMLSGQELPDTGRVVLHGHDLATDLAGLQRSVGVCPQFDVLYGELSAVEHLRLYAALRGVPRGQATDREVQRLVEQLDLTIHAHKPSAALSGGNRRKLSVAIALMGRPPVIILDEPSTGMDPASKRFMWGVITQLRQRHTIILTTHSMEECEAVAQRVGVMVRGRLAALGSLQRLKTRFGQHYQVDAVCGSTADATRAGQALTAALPGSQVAEQHGQQIRLSVPLADSRGNRTSLATVLEVLEQHRAELGIRAYLASQASLEQIFLNLSAKADTKA